MHPKAEDILVLLRQYNRPVLKSISSKLDGRLTPRLESLGLITIDFVDRMERYELTLLGQAKADDIIASRAEQAES